VIARTGCLNHPAPRSSGDKNDHHVFDLRVRERDFASLTPILRPVPLKSIELAREWRDPIAGFHTRARTHRTG